MVVFATELSTTYRKLKLRAGVDSEPERGGPPSVGKPGDLQLGFAIGAGVLGHLSSASEGLTGPAGELILIAHRLLRRLSVVSSSKHH